MCQFLFFTFSPILTSEDLLHLFLKELDGFDVTAKRITIPV